MHKILLLILSILCSGCLVFLRYHFENALNNLPSNYKLIRLTNTYIDYNLYGTNYRAYYTGDEGKIYRTIILKD
jgi:hypothetical protein